MDMQIAKYGLEVAWVEFTFLQLSEFYFILVRNLFITSYVSIIVTAGAVKICKSEYSLFAELKLL